MPNIGAPTRELVSRVTRKGQVTIPVEIRRLLGVEPRDKVAFVVEDNQVRIARSGSVVARTAGALKGDRPAPSAEELREAAERAIAADVVERMGG
jgi:AbrB family looped-hinge helix DNA binding protein